MTCAELHRYLSLHLDSELSPETAADLARHLESCSACAERVRAEEKLEARIRESLRRPAPGDDAAWKKAMEALPPRRARWPYAAAAIVLASGLATLFLFTRHSELDLAATLAEHHKHYIQGKSPLEVSTSDPAKASQYFQEKLPFAASISAPVPAGTQLVGGRLCYLEGAPTAFYIFHCDRSVVVAAVFSAEDLTRFPMAQERLRRDGEVHCRVQGMSFVLTSDPSRAVTAVGNVTPEQLSAIVRLFLER